MKTSEVKAELKSEIGFLLTKGEDAKIDTTTDFGRFSCSVETFDQFTIVQRNFETENDPFNIPFSCYEPSVQMIFSFNGQSVFSKKFDPFFLAPSSHCINFFQGYDCTNLLAGRSRQHDITFRLKKGFYADLVTQYLSSKENRLPSMIALEKEFNTINQHLPTDAAIVGILKNILNCPFEGEMQAAFIREHVRALLMLQIFHFNGIVGSDEIKLDQRITLRDRETLYAIREYIDKHFLEPASLESLSRRFCLNEFKLKHGFKVLFETSPLRYLQQKRLAFALALLRDTDKTIKEISKEIGYAHPANFTAAFAKAFGRSPQHYRT